MRHHPHASRPSPGPTAPVTPGRGLPTSAREARIRSLKARIRDGSYDADGKIASLIDEVVRDAL